MAKNVKINGVTYSSVPYVSIPNASGSGNSFFYDTSAATITANDVRSGKTGYGTNGSVDGNLADVTLSSTSISTKAQEIAVTAGIHSGTQKVSISSTEQAKIIASNIKSGVTILGVEGGLSAATISQDGSTKVLSIS